MKRERRIRVLRRLVLGLAVAVAVAPAAQASAVVLEGDEKAIVRGDGGPTALVHGDDKQIVPWTGDTTVLIHGDDKTFAPAPSEGPALIAGDDKVIAPEAGDYALAGYRRALPQDYGDPTAVPVGGPSSPSTFDWGDAFIGAAVAFALMLLAGGATLAARRRERPAAA